MELLVLRIFQRQVADQARLALNAVPAIDAGAELGDQNQLWAGVQVFVSAAGNVAKALWGAGASRSDARLELRRSLNVPDDSPLRAVSLRNHFEHYDERIERWYKQSTHHNHLDRMIGPPDAVSGLEDIDRFRVYDPSNSTVYFWGEPFEIRPIAGALGTLQPVAEEQSNLPHWNV